MLFFLLHLFIAALGPTWLPQARRIDDFQLHDCRGATRKLSDWQESTAVVIVFLGVECPLNKLYAPRLTELVRQFEPRGAAFIGIDSNASDSLAAIAGFA